MVQEISRYGVKETKESRDSFDNHAEEIDLQGYTVVESALDDSAMNRLSEAFEQARKSYELAVRKLGCSLADAGEGNIVRALPVFAPAFFDALFDRRLHELLERILGGYYIVNQINGLRNPAGPETYSQAAYHRDLPYQHFTSSRPLALSAILALDDFSAENGATFVLPGSHKSESFPSDEVVRKLGRQVALARGSFLVMDSMLYHSGGQNRSAKDRRAVNHVFTIPLLRQQLYLPAVIREVLGSETADRLSAAQKRFLGFDVKECRSLAEWMENRSRAARAP